MNICFDNQITHVKSCEKYERDNYPELVRIRQGWEIYKLNETRNCEKDFGMWKYLSRLSDDVGLCDEFGEDIPCYISMISTWDYNKEYCDFEVGDIIFVYR